MAPAVQGFLIHAAILPITLILALWVGEGRLGFITQSGMQGQIAKDAMRSVRHIYSNLRNGKEDTATQKLWNEFRDIGGQTGYRQLSNSKRPVRKRESSAAAGA